MTRTSLQWLAGHITAGVALVAVGSGCGAPAEPSAATLVVTTSTSGIDLDADGYVFALDDEAGRPVGRNATLTLSDLEPGEHRVMLEGGASNCTVQGENPRRVTVSPGATATVKFYVTCAAATGALTIHTVTSGDGQDPDGYDLLLDADGNRRLPTNGMVAVTGLPAGDHRVEIADVISNCRLDGEPVRTVSVRAGETLDLTVSVACVARALRVLTTTSGRSPDRDGYTVAVDGRAPQPIAVTGSLELGGLTDGEHRVTLSDLADFCDVGENPRTVQVSETAASVRFDVDCPGAPSDGRILFDGAVRSETHVFRMNADGSGLVDLTPGANGYAARWSPDRSRIVFETTRNGGAEVFVMSADGSHQARLASGASPAWSPDGSRIVFISSSGLTVMNADGSNRRSLPTGRSPASPAWSPDGRAIAYAEQNPGRCTLILFDPVCARDIYIVNSDGSGAHLVTSAPDALTRSGSPAWSPDGSTLAFSRTRLVTTESDLYLVAADGTGLVQLTATTTGAETSPVWSPDGRALLFGSRAGSGNADLTLIPRRGGTPTRLLSRPGDQVPTSWR